MHDYSCTPYAAILELARKLSHWGIILDGIVRYRPADDLQIASGHFDFPNGARIKVSVHVAGACARVPESCIKIREHVGTLELCGFVVLDQVLMDTIKANPFDAFMKGTVYDLYDALLSYTLVTQGDDHASV